MSVTPSQQGSIGPLAAAAPARSWLFVPATRPDRFAKAAASGADRIILDLEDAVAPEAKGDARRNLGASPLPSGPPVYVRVNGSGTEWIEEDLAVAAALPIAGVVVPKAERAEQLARIAAALPPTLPIVAILETALGLWNALEVARAPGVERLAFGAVDFQLDVGARDGEALQLAYARSRIVIATRVAGVAAPIDAISLGIDDEAAVAREAEQARRFGFGGKLCIHPRQVAPTHRAYAPNAAELAWAEGLLDALAARRSDERGAFAYEGGMVDRPVIERAKQIVSLASQERTRT